MNVLMRGTSTAVCDARRDGGFSLAEVLFATLVLFFVATALIGLAVSSTVTAATAQQKNLMTNAVNSYMEEMKGLDFTDIGMADPGAGEVSGLLADETSMTIDGYVIYIRPTVKWVDDPNMMGTQDYKFVRIEAQAIPTNGGADVTYTMETQIRNTDVGWAWGEYSSETSGSGSEGPEAPEIAFTETSPQELDVVYGTAIEVGADAVHPMTNGLLTNMFFYVGAQPMRNAAWEMAQFTINSDTYSSTFYWDSTALMDDGVTQISPDGIRTVKVEVWDNIGQQAFKVRRVLVDNFAPPEPGDITVEWMTDETIAMSWDAVFDGTDPAPYYFLGIDEDQNGAWVHTHDRCGDQVEDLLYEMPVITNTVTDGFRRFKVRLYTQSPRFWSPYHTTGVGIVSPPGMDGTYEAERSTSGNNAYCHLWNGLSWDSVKFPVTGYEATLWRAQSPDMAGKVEVDSWTDPAKTEYVDYIYTSGKKQDTFVQQYWYQLEVDFRATGPNPSGQLETVRSPIVGANATSGSGTMASTWE